MGRGGGERVRLGRRNARGRSCGWRAAAKAEEVTCGERSRGRCVGSVGGAGLGLPSKRTKKCAIGDCRAADRGIVSGVEPRPEERGCPRGRRGGLRGKMRGWPQQLLSNILRGATSTCARPGALHGPAASTLEEGLVSALQYCSAYPAGRKWSCRANWSCIEFVPCISVVSDPDGKSTTHLTVKYGMVLYAHLCFVHTH